MDMTLNIYRNGEKVNTIKTKSKTNIYKSVAQVFFTEYEKRATKTITNYLNNKLKIKQIFDQTKTQIKNGYTYEYIINDIML